MQSSEEPSEHRHRGGRFLMALVLLLILPVVYPLGVGPVMKLRSKGKISQRTLWGLYKPMFLLADQSPVFNRVLWWYIDDVWKTNLDGKEYDPFESR